ncbi:MAG TPA: hypothetical protein VGD74_11415 [Vulgatibacter sp.]
MRRIVFLSCWVALAGCASVETRLREARADRDTIEGAFGSPHAHLRSLAAESCAWSRTADCEGRLEEMAREDADAGVRDAAIRTLGRLCGDDARLALLRLVGQTGASDAMRSAAGDCPTADLALDLADPGRTAGSFEEKQRRLAWLDGVVAMPAPRDRAKRLRERLARELRREHEEAARAIEVSKIREEAWAALNSSRWEDAASRIETLAAMGAPSGDLLRRLAGLRLARESVRFHEALRAGEFFEAQWILASVPELQIVDPTLATRIEFARYDSLLPKAQAAERLARRGDVDEARTARQQLLSQEGEAVLIDLAKASRHRAEAHLEKGRFAEAWAESWSLRETETVASDKFVARFAAERWRREGFDMTRTKLASFVDDVGEHAPVEAKRRLELFGLLDGVATGNASAASEATRRIAADLRSWLERCNKADRGLPTPADEFSLQEMPAALEYLAQRVTTQRKRVELRRVRDEGKALAKKVEAQRPRLHDVSAAADRCLEAGTELEYYEGAPPGSEAYAKARIASKKVHACLVELSRQVDTFARQGSDCRSYLEKAAAVFQQAMQP